MRAIYIKQHGAVDALKVSEVPKPAIGAGDVLVRVEASGINPSDVASVEGKFAGSVLPRIVGRDFAGQVVEGPSDLIGEEVWGSGGDLGIFRDGTHAEYVAIPRKAVARRPKNLSAEEAAVVGVPFITAFSALVPLGRLKKGEWVIISGAAGSVGQAAIQLARAKGACIVALIKDESEEQKLKSGTVQAIAQSDRGDLNRVVREATSGKGADLALNAAGSSIFGALIEALALGGRQVVFSVAGGRESTLDLLSFYKNQFALYGLDTQKFDATECAGILNELAPLFESGALQPPTIDSRYELSEAAQAYGKVAAGGSGKVVFVMASQRS
ncbi:MAG: zinc-binding alcohol dehydrogenase family protein [Candidatus Acidiferrales bacterium]